MDKAIEWIQGNPVELGLIGILFVFVLGIFLGFKKVVIVYRDFTDVGVVCLMVLVPASVFIGMLYLGVDSIDFITTPFLIFEAVMLLVILVRSLSDNKNPLKALLAVLVKIPLSIIFVVNVIDFIVPDERRKRKGPLIILLLFTPIILALVNKKEGFCTPLNALRRYGVR